jgi:long-chain acyl-CoA synthetase
MRFSRFTDPGVSLVIVPWTIGGLLRELTARGEHPAVISFGEDGVVPWGSETLVEKALRLARGLREDGVSRGCAVALWAPNSPVWIAASLAVMAAGGMLVPIDELADAEQFEAALNSSGARLILTTARHLEASGAVLCAHGVSAIRIDEGGRSGQGATAWQALANKQAEDLPVLANDEPAMLSWTSGTTGSPKAFMLTHRNIASNVEALQKLAAVGPRDRALVPLPLHHAYPFVVGMLTTLTLGTTIVLPGGTTGPLLIKALHDGKVTTIIGVPRLYEALWAAIEARLKGYSLTLRLAWRALLRVTIFVQQSSGLRPAVERASSGMFSVRSHQARNCSALAIAGLGRGTAGEGHRGTAGSSWLDGAVRIWAGRNRVAIHRQSPE